MKTNKRRERQAERVGRVVRFLRANPLSTAQEVYAATGCGVLQACGYIKQAKYEGKVVWRLNHKKVNAN